MGLFGKVLGGGGNPPPPPPSQPGGFFHHSDGQEFKPEHAQVGPFPKHMRLRANLTDYQLKGSWMEVVLTGPQDYEPIRNQVFGGYYKQYGLYRLPDGSDTIRWNETSWREIREDLTVEFDPSYHG